MYYFENVQKLREKSGKTSTEIAECLGISQELYEKYESGESLMPVEYFIKLADLYNVSMDYLVGRDFKK